MASPTDPRVHCNQSTLVGLQSQAAALNAPSLLRLHGVMAGQRLSRLRGRGLNFEELRHYRQGDDVRHIDWPVTMRTRKPHIRVYNEEKDHHVVLCVDQRSNMFFASVDTMKSVVAAEIAALVGWAILQKSDRVGLSVFGDDQIVHNRPTRTQSNYLHQLRQLVGINRSLSVESAPGSGNRLAVMLDRLLQDRDKNGLILILSDFYQCDPDCIRKLQYLQRHNHLLCVAITDPLEASFDADDWTLTDGELQISIDSSASREAIQRHLLDAYQQRQNDLTRLMAASGLPLIELDTSGQHLSQFQRAIGR
ncbi:MoxR protein [Marinobacterium nitratireducens]|uniref:MoxR protein n=1 Tax=Marinobacterium nitratireducens TaxID=518897 RepID=A0A917Z9E5_9GAMM|nr:DUF58 domain-containing protein [Marinobacterium nitratireducens]GGO78936.1 MoxR protein [Marinobacterium nitratireducens]